jgi:hypothetical protein
MVWHREFLKDARAALAGFWLSWVRALSADCDGPPSWFWPSCMTGTVIALVWGGFYFAADRAAFVLAVIPVFCGFVTITFGAWLLYRGWKWIRAGKPKTTGGGNP